LLSEPVKIKNLTLSPGERAEIIVEIIKGEPLKLVNIASPSNGRSRGPMMMRGMNNEKFEILSIRPKNSLKVVPALPSILTTIEKLQERDVSKTRRFTLEMGMGPRMMRRGGGQFTINGQAMDINRIDERVKLGDTEIWEIRNASPMTHPFHIHDIQFQILDRDGKRPDSGEQGWKDTVRVHQDEVVRLIMRFDDYADPNIPYMYHCHILEHEDGGMMGQFVVV
jgi:FtsP/CotA-like multicopper oxidase with cupredoxin domain